MMGDKKHIDRLFQERFKDFEATPKDVVWTNIEAELKQNKKKRKVVPIWWRYAGVAAVLLLLISIGYTYFNETEQPHTPKMVDTQKPKTSNHQKLETEDIISKETIIANTQEKNTPPHQAKKVLTPPKSVKRSLHSNNTINSIANTSEIHKKETVQSNSNIDTHNSKNIYSQGNFNTIAENKTSKKELNLNSNKKSIHETNTSNIITQKHPKTTAIADSKVEEKSTSAITEVTIKETLSIENAIKNQNDLATNKTNESSNKWNIAPNIAPVYFSSLGNGSSIDAQYSNNPKDGEVNMSYGISARYAINNKITIKSGVNRVHLGYNTNDITITRSTGDTSAQALQNLDNGNGGIISVNNTNSKNTTSDISINQSFSYVEIPLEIQYAISTKRFGVNVIGGFSSLFLSSNDLFSEFEGKRTRIGAAKNLNKTSYSANLGLGLNYQISDKINLNLEPMFKYQINAFNNTSGNFNPYFIGVYTGVGFKF